MSETTSAVAFQSQRSDPPYRKIFVIYGAIFVILAAIFLIWPEIDLWVSAFFYDPALGTHGFYHANNTAIQGIRKFLDTKASYIVLVIPIVGVLHYMTRQSFGNRNGRVLIFLLLAIIVGPGLVVNLVFKENWGRARPYQTENFGRDKQFTPALVMTDQCPRNCSFVSGDVSFVVAFSALVMLARNRRRMLIGASALAVAAGLMSFQRIMLGSHFLSDTLFSIFFTLGITWALYQLIVRRKWRDCWHWIESKDARWLAHKEKLRKEG